MKPFKQFQVRWKEPLGKPECPYMYRWIMVCFGFGIRLHHWIRSDDKRHFHSHPWDFLTIVLKGSYTDVSLINNTEPVKMDKVSLGSIRFRKAEHLHYVDVPKSGAWTLLFTFPKKQNWGFWINGRIMRPLRYFSRYDHPPCTEQ